MISHRQIFKYFLLFGVVLCTGVACSPHRSTHGNLVEEKRIQKLEIGQFTKNDVVQTLGSPTSRAAFNDNIWYYIGLETVKQGFLDPKIENKRVFVATFDENDLLSSFEEQTADGIDIPIVARETPTHGTEMTVLEQFLGNVGRFNSDGDTSGIGTP